VAALLASAALFARPSADGNDPGAASAALARAVEAPDDAGRENDLGNHLLLGGDLDGAEAAYRRALALAPDSVPPRINLGRLQLERGRRFAARRELLGALELDPEHAEAHYFLGVVYDDWGFERLARKRYRRAFELSPALADPKLHPEAVRRRQALAAMLALWRSEPTALAPEPGAPVVPPPARDVERARQPAAGAEAAKPADSSPGGGYARVTGGERTGRSLPEENAGAFSAAAEERRERARAASPKDRRIDRSNLGSGGLINQALPPGESRKPSQPPRGFGKPAPQQRPSPRFQPPPRTFDEGEESTGRIEPLLLPATPGAFAIAG
jgi:tetratricopeptide (TPR) repeat protein